MRNICLFIIVCILIIWLISDSIDNFKSRGMEITPKWSEKEVKNLELGQQKMTNMLQECDRICRKYNIDYIVIGGTLLGAIRHKGWIPYDGDIDIAINAKQYDVFKDIVQKELPSNMWYQNPDIDPHWPTKSIHKIRDLNSCYIGFEGTRWHQGLQIDIFRYDFDKNGHLICEFTTNPPRYSNMKYDDVYPIKRLPFEDIYVNVPNNYIGFLEFEFGKNWSTIYPVNKRYPDEGKIDSFNTCPHHKKIYPHLSSPRS